MLLLNDDILETDLNRVGYRVTDLSTGTAITEAVLTHEPNMPSMGHSCPHTEPATVPNADGLFEARVVFSMGGAWANTVVVTPQGGTEHSLEIGDLTVTQVDDRRKILQVTQSERYLTTLNWDDAAYGVGDNPFVLTVHRTGTWEAQTDLDITVTPYMPDHGHGSMGNTDPAHGADGEYVGSVNLTMDGYWTVTFELTRGVAVLGEVVYDLTL